MQQLHLVGFTTDLDQLILSVRKGAKSGSFLVPLDERLLEEIAEAVRRRNDDQTTGAAPPLEVPPEIAAAARAAGEGATRTRPASALTPREIQARLRSGRSIAEVAKEAGVDEDWITKFASPVFAERAQIIRAARQLVFSTPRRGESAEPLGASVRRNLADRGVRFTDEEFDSCWDAYLVGDALWGVTFEAVSRGRPQQAVWEVDLREEEVIARNRVASDYGFVDATRRRNPPPLAPESKAARSTSRSVRSAGKTARTTKAARGTSTKKQAAKASGKQGTKRSGAPPVAPLERNDRITTEAPNELAKHRLRLVQSERANERGAAVGRSTPRVTSRPSTFAGRPYEPQPPPRRPAPERSEPELEPDLATEHAPEPEIELEPIDDALPEPQPAVVRFDEEAARRRREERRRARAAAREANGRGDGTDNGGRSGVGRSGTDSGTANGSGDRARLTGFEPPPPSSSPPRSSSPSPSLDIPDPDPEPSPRRQRPELPPAPPRGPSPASPAPPRAPSPVAEGSKDEGRVVTIRASRAGSAGDNGRRESPRDRGRRGGSEGSGDVIVRSGGAPLRPARPAVQPVQPRRRRFGRGK